MQIISSPAHPNIHPLPLLRRCLLAGVAALGLCCAQASQLSAQTLYIADYQGAGVKKATPTPGASPMTFASGLQSPADVAFDSASYLYVADSVASAIDKVAPDGTTSVFATAGLSAPTALAFDAAGNLYAAYQPSKIVRRYPAPSK